MLYLSTSSLRGYGLHRIFSFARTAGYDGLDLSLSGDDFDTCDPAYVSGLARAYGFRVPSITAYETDMDETRLGLVMKLALTLKSSIVTFYPPEGGAAWYDTYLPQVQARYPDITLSVVNMPPKTTLLVIPGYNKNATLQNIRKVTGYTSLAINHVLPESGVDLLKTFTMLGNTIRMVYLADRSSEKGRDGLLPGRGYMPIESLLVKLREAGYTGPFTLTVRPSELGAGASDAQVLARLADVKAYVQRYMPETPAPLPPAPPAPLPPETPVSTDTATEGWLLHLVGSPHVLREGDSNG